MDGTPQDIRIVGGQAQTLTFWNKKAGALVIQKKPYAILRIASDRRYHAQDGRSITDFVSVKVRGKLAQRCAAYAVKGCKLTAFGDFEAFIFDKDPSRQPGFLIKATEVEFLTLGRVEEAAAALSPEEDEPDA